MLKAVNDPRAPGATFALGDIGWIDFETRSELDIKVVGADRYSRNCSAIVLAFAIGDGSIYVESSETFGEPLRWQDMPEELHDFHDRVVEGEAVYCAHNAAFDRGVWYYGTEDFPRLEPHMIIDSRVQAAASGLPGDLDRAAKYAGAVNKLASGKKLIKLFSFAGSGATPETHPDEWEQFLDYAYGDIDAMRSLFKHTRQLPRAEWEEYWAAERVNDRGICIDLHLVAQAAKMAAADRAMSAIELSALTNKRVGSVDQVKNMVNWLRDVLPSDGIEILVKRTEEKDEDGVVTRPAKWQLTRDRVVKLIAYLQSLAPLSGPLWAAERLLQIRRYGGSKTPAKFARMLNSHVDGVIRGQYAFNGASQTGRFSARGIQVHNLARDPLAYEIDAIDALVAGIEPEAFATLGDDAPISRKLSLLIRPTLVAAPGNCFVWSDWANIEARLLPWLADDREADKRLDIFREVDADPSIPDIYTRTAARISGVPVEAVDKKLRQRGKVVELAAGFGGSTNALLSMAANFNMYLDPDEAKRTVTAWREENAWAVRFWGKHENSLHQSNSSYGLWGALNRALEQPGTPHRAGRITYVFWKNYLGGSLMCLLPSGRWLTYRRCRWERVEELDEDTGEVIDVRRELMFSRDNGRVKLWPGLACENVVQATAADILRGTLLRLESFENAADQPVRLHTHDEVLVECAEAYAGAAAADLRWVMEHGWKWTEGLPIKADATIGRWYTKNEDSEGL